MMNELHSYEFQPAPRECAPLGPADSSLSSRSIQAKQTGATLAETFSSYSNNDDGRDPEDEERLEEIDLYADHRGGLPEISDSKRSVSFDRSVVEKADDVIRSDSQKVLTAPYTTCLSRRQLKNLELSVSGVGSDIHRKATTTASEEDESPVSQASSPLQSFFSSDSGSSWEGSACSASREHSLLDSAGESQECNNYTNSFDDDDGHEHTYDYATDDEEDMGHAGTLADVFQNINGFFVESRTSSVDEDKTRPAKFEFLPPIDFSKSGLLGFRSASSSSSDHPDTTNRPDVGALFSRMSVLSKEFMSSGEEEEEENNLQLATKPEAKMASKPRNDLDPTKKIMKSLVSSQSCTLISTTQPFKQSLTFFLLSSRAKRDIFSCGAPNF
jgi:hypothetical protein